MKTPDEISQQLDLINERLDELEETTHAIRHAQKMAVFWRIMYYLFLIAIGVGLFVWARPWLDRAQKGFQDLQNTFFKTQTSINNAQQKMQNFQDFFSEDQP
ncbi:MAG TPA: hypothetical protein VGE63_02240 [Candidatus Paceibacterota bacterium]